MTDTKRNRKLNPFKYIFEPDYVVNLKLLINRLKKMANAPDICLIESWGKLENNYVLQRHQKYTDKIFTTISDDAAQFCSRIMFADKKYIRDYLLWHRVSASYGSLSGAIELLDYSVEHEFDEQTVRYWLDKVMSVIKETLSVLRRADECELVIKQALEALVNVGRSHNQLALTGTLDLMVYAKKWQLTIKDEVDAHTRKLISESGGIRVIDAIGESSDRAVTETCERYSLLEKSVTRLAKIQNIRLMKNTLDAEFPWYSSLTKKVVDSLMVRLLGNGAFYVSPLLILGEPGIGKTTYVKRLAELSKVPYQVISLAGQNDNRYLQGTARGWSSGQPSMPVTLINDHQIANPIVILDEIDKAGGSDHNGRSIDSLLTLFEPSSAVRVFDEYLLGHADLSHISWICTANDISQMPKTILSRLDVVTVNGPRPEHYPAIINKSIKDFCNRNGIHHAQIPVLTDVDWLWLEKYYKSPRLARKAAERWLAHAMLNPIKQLIN